MKNFLILSLCSLVAWCLPGTISAQQDFIRNLFEGEAPIFYSEILPSAEPGAVKIAYYFTHSKINSLEVSLWLRELGPTMLHNGSKTMARGLAEIVNRQADTVVLRGLKDHHFYEIGVDFRNPRTLSRRFSGQSLQEAYRFEPSGFSAPPGEPVLAEKRVLAATPCQNPSLSMWLEPSGYCGSANRPALLIQCRDCAGKSWRYSVEYQSGVEPWRPLRGDSQWQVADAANISAPLCALATGVYNLRVIAWGEGCAEPAIHHFNGPATVVETREQPAHTYAETPGVHGARAAPLLPDTCEVSGHATLFGNRINGVLELADRSPCGPFNPSAELRYVHPGHRDVEVRSIALAPDQKSAFEIILDGKDLNRSIHPIQVVISLRANQDAAPIPLNSFWIRANDVRERARAAADIALEQRFDTVSVAAGDPNCNQIQNLQVFYHRSNPDLPVYLSWLSPRCCQESGCAYAVWAGPAHNQLRLLVQGNKPGSIIQELLSGAITQDTYFEVVVKTPNGNRKAAFIIGEGPKYGIEEIIEYHDRVSAPKSDPLAFPRTTISGSDQPILAWDDDYEEEEEEEMAPTALTPKGFNDSGEVVHRAPNGGGPAFRWNNEPGASGAQSAASAASPRSPAANAPRLPASDFQPCQNQRPLKLSGDAAPRPGSQVTIQYDHSRDGYRYSLYFLPHNGTEWVIAPGTRELQPSAAFTFTVTSGHSGKYLVLAYKADKKWGCLSSAPDKAMKISIPSN
jgi:hypothetical protein